MSARRLGIGLMALVMGSGCKKVEPAPKELDDLFHYGWSLFESGEDEELAQAVVNFHAALEGDAMEDALDGNISALSLDETGLVGREEVDPALAIGMYIARPVACDLDSLVDILVAPNQDELYDGVYDEYSRDYAEEPDAFAGGELETLSWDLEYTSSLLGATYTATADGMLRRVPVLEGTDAEGGELSPYGESIWFRSYAPGPAEFEGDNNKNVNQDYQLEAFWEPEPGRILHVYAMWREANYGSGYDTASEGVQRIIVNNMASWDDNTEVLCEEGW